MVQIRDFLSHDWQTVGAIQVALEDAGFPMAEMDLIHMFQTMQGVVVKDGKVRQVAYAEGDA